MLAKVPVRRLDGKSSFASLLSYVIKDAVAIAHSSEVWSPDTAPGEMEQVASFSRAKDPVYHYVLSWRETEIPTDDEAFDSVKETLTALRMHDNQWVAAVHRNTKNVHAHVAVNRVDPKTYRAVSIFRDWLALDRTCREIEVKRGWMHDNGPHRVEHSADGGTLVVRTLPDRSSNMPATPSTRARDYAAWNGRDNFQEWIGKDPAQALKVVLQRPDASWNDVHKSLAAFNLEYRTKGSGAIIVDRNEPDKLHAKASHLCRFASRGQLETRLGPYRGPADASPPMIIKTYRTDVEGRGVRIDDHIEEPRAAPKRSEQSRAEWRSTNAHERESAWNRQEASERARRAALRDQSWRVRQWINDSAPQRDKTVLRSLEHIRTAVGREDLNSQIQQERKRLRAQLSGKDPGPSREWLNHEADTNGTIAAEDFSKLRRRAPAAGKAAATDREWGSHEPTRNIVLRNLAWNADSAGVNYFYDGRTIFSDEGSRVVIKDLSKDRIRAGLALANEKWTHGISLAGTEAFLEKATRLAAEMGITVGDGGMPQRGMPDLNELSRRYQKPIVESQPIVGRRHSGKLVAASTVAYGMGIAVIDAGRELTVVQIDKNSTTILKARVGKWVQAYVAHRDSQSNDLPQLAWQIRELELNGPER